MKKVISTLGILAVVSSSAMAQHATPPPKPQPRIIRITNLKFCDRFCVVSILAAVGGSALDIGSSIGYQELNPLFRRKDGTFNPWSNMAFKGGLIGVTLIGQREHPKAMGCLRIAIGSAFAAAGIYNLGREGKRK